MPSSHKRPFEDFFRPYGRTDTFSPQKRRSVSGSTDEEPVTVTKHVPKTPAKTVTFKDVTPKSTRSFLFSPHSPASLPIRSPKPNKTLSPTSSRQTTLFSDIARLPPLKLGKDQFCNSANATEPSQKVVEGVKIVVVRDSDDDTDSLESLDDILGRRKDAGTTSDSSPPDDLEAERAKMLKVFTGGRSAPIVGKEKLRALYAKDRAIKFDLGAILDDHFGDEEAQQKITLMRAGFDGTDDPNEDDKLDTMLLASVVRSGDTDQDNVDRLLNAVERTEALSADKSFSFFRTSSVPRDVSPRKDAFPRSGIPHQLWAPGDTEARGRMYMSGYLSELAAVGEMSDEALKWTFAQVATEPEADLRRAYLDCLKASSKMWTRLNVTASDVQHLFHHLGADGECIYEKGSIRAKYQPAFEQPRECSNLGSVLHLLHDISLDMDFLALSKLASIVLRMTLDKSLMSNSQVCRKVELLLERLLSLPDAEARDHIYSCIVNDAKQNLSDPQLQIRLLSHILPTSPDAIVLRKSLADAFLIGSSTVSRDGLISNATLDTLLKHVSQSESFSLTRHVDSSAIDYTALTARTQILNVAVSCNDISNYTPSSISQDELASTKQSPEELQFNTSVDNLADQLHTLFVSIKDTGASHMRRTEAKDTLQALYFRLLFSVRTRPRKKRHVFDPSGEFKAGNHKARWMSGEEYRAKERGGEFMKRFFATTQASDSG